MFERDFGVLSEQVMGSEYALACLLTKSTVFALMQIKSLLVFTDGWFLTMQVDLVPVYTATHLSSVVLSSITYDRDRSSVRSCAHEIRMVESDTLAFFIAAS